MGRWVNGRVGHQFVLENESNKNHIILTFFQGKPY